MRAIVYEAYGKADVLKLKEVPKPTPDPKQLLVRVKATAVNSGDWRLRKPDPFAVRLFWGLTKPKKNILGIVFSGAVEAKGAQVSKYKVGDEIFGSLGMATGAYAEYICVHEDATMTHKPANLTHQEAAVIPFGGTTALHFIRKAAVKQGQKVLIYGASGAVGTAAVQLAKHYGAEVTGVCSGGNIDLVKSLGADKVVDYTKQDFAESKESYDVVFVTVNKISFGKSLQSLKENGTLILSDAGVSEMLKGAWTSMIGKRKILFGMISETAEDMVFLKKLIEAGQYKAVIDKVYPLEEMATAHAYAEQGHKKGNVAVVV